MYDRADIGLIDIEETIEVPTEWDSSWWIDHIHPRQIGMFKLLHQQGSIWLPLEKFLFDKGL